MSKMGGTCEICEDNLTQAWPYRFVQKASQKRLELDLETWVDREGRRRCEVELYSKMDHHLLRGH